MQSQHHTLRGERHCMIIGIHYHLDKAAAAMRLHTDITSANQHCACGCDHRSRGAMYSTAALLLVLMQYKARLTEIHEEYRIVRDSGKVCTVRSRCQCHINRP